MARIMFKYLIVAHLLQTLIWVYPTGGSWKTYGLVVVSKRGDSDDAYVNYQFILDDVNGRPSLSSSDGASSKDCQSTYDLSFGNWYHVVGVYDGSDCFVYVDGIQVYTENWGITPYTDDSDVFVGVYGDGDIPEDAADLDFNDTID